jgi:hypothetical protein
MLTWLTILASRVRGLLTAGRQDDDFDAEVTAHLELLTDENMRRGLTPGEARRQAILRFGGPVQTRERQHDSRGLPVVDTTLQDIRYATRSLRRNAGFAAVAILTLAVGVNLVLIQNRLELGGVA